jgi:dolichol kinase
MVNVKKKIIESRDLINSIDFDVHWYRRVFHAFGASLLFYYMLPDVDWINILRAWVPPIIVVIAITLEILRIKGVLSSDHFFGLRMYEKNRVGSYVFFAVAILILLRFFPQQIAIPCILCACLGDPLIGEIRHRFDMKYVYILGFLICMVFFLITWYKVDLWLTLLVAVVGAFGAIIGETKKFWWLDDDFTIQMVPAILLLIIWLSFPYFGIAEPEPVIYYGLMPW